MFICKLLLFTISNLDTELLKFNELLPNVTLLVLCLTLVLLIIVLNDE